MSSGGARPATELERSSGIVLHPTSLPGGRLGIEAERFVDWLAAAGQSWWQVLPLGPPDRHGSPYASTSAFAAWRGLLAEPEADVTSDELERFREANPYWIGDWERYAGAGAAADQVRFDREWSGLRRYAAERGVRIMGDVPIYVAPESADVRAHPELFDTSAVAGAPADYLNPDGQHWGNPLYRWPAHDADGYRWWIERFRRTFELFDLARLDHFRGFVAYWAIPPNEPVARNGRWRPGPGYDFFRVVEREFEHFPIVVEDLGVITPEVDRLREEVGAPGMRVMQYAFDDDPLNVHQLANHPEDSVVYTGTHDNDPAAGWWSAVPEAVRQEAWSQIRAAGIAEDDPVWGLIRLTFTSRAQLAVLQMQDILGLGSEARLNAPGTTTGNWSWRLGPGQLTDSLAERLRAATAETGRLASP